MEGAQYYGMLKTLKKILSVKWFDEIPLKNKMYGKP
jgi:hypothetical protein